MEKNRYFAELVIPHVNCPLLELKEKYGRSIKNVRIIPVLGGNGREQYEMRMSVDFKISKQFIEDVRKKEGIELIDDAIGKNHLEVYCNVKDEVLRILDEVAGENGGFSITRYDLTSNYKPLRHSGEYLYLSVPDREFFVTTVLDELRRVSFENKIDWRLQKGWKIKKIPALSLTEQYMADYAVEHGYVDNFDKKKLTGLSEELKMGLDELATKVDEVLGEICFEFLKKIRKET